MQCPLCLETALEARFHSGIEIDVCPKCKGVWLDRGELAKLAAAPDAPSNDKEDRERSKKSKSSSKGRDRDRDGDRDKSNKSKSSKSKKKRKKGFGERLGDVLDDVLDFDFD